MANGRWNPLRTLFLDNQMHVDIYDPASGFDFNRAAWYRNLMDSLRREYSYAIPSYEIIGAIRTIAGDHIVELGAGTGYWAKFLSQYGLDVLAFDTKDTRSSYCNDVYYYKVNEAGHEALSWNSDRSLLLCWPPYRETFAYDCLRAYQGNSIIFIGEDYGGCTGTDEFFDLLEKDWELIYRNYDVLNFSGIHSCETIYKRKSDVNKQPDQSEHKLEDTIY